MPPYPTVHQIEEIFQTGEGGPEGFIDHIDPKVQVYIVGHDHHLAGEISGKDTLKDDHFAHFADLMDFDKPNKLEILRVIGGGDSPWACVEVICTGKSKAGKKLSHECCFVVRFNLEGKITKFRAYYDSAHMNDHAEVHKAHKEKTRNGST
ncbi:MAG: hypothetical protein Q9205_003864 [Flavoplaca limonia]